MKRLKYGNTGNSERPLVAAFHQQAKNFYGNIFRAVIKRRQ
jgi:hypothetical protein